MYTYSPANAEELFNLCHASACNIVKQMFGILNNYITDDMEDPQPGAHEGELVTGPARINEKCSAETWKNGIAHHMWIQYQEELRHRGIA
jgi:hypothetical protein